MASAETVEDDQVVERLDVFVSKTLENQLYILQYPLRRNGQGYKNENDNAPTDARIKAKMAVLELEVPIETQRELYDAQLGFAFGQQHKPIRPSDSDQLASQTLVSSIVPPKTHYFAGIVKDGQLHLTAVKATLQMHPSFDYLDNIDNQAKKEAKPQEESEEEEEKDDEGKLIQVQIKKRESERAQAVRKRSHAYLQKQVESDPWVNLKFFDEATEEADIAFSNMLCNSSSQVKIERSKAIYLSTLIPPPSETKK